MQYECCTFNTLVSPRPSPRHFIILALFADIHLLTQTIQYNSTTCVRLHRGCCYPVDMLPFRLLNRVQPLAFSKPLPLFHLRLNSTVPSTQKLPLQPTNTPPSVTPPVNPSPQPPNALFDSFNRAHTYLRLSLTERCNLRCIYCMPDTTPEAPPPPTHLTTPELLRVARLFASRGVTKIRLTGGEPLLRHDLVPVTRQLASIPGVSTLAITTNAVTLSRVLPRLLDAGLNSINISLDTLCPLRFELLTRRKGHARVLRAIDECLAAQLPTKVNVVVMNAINDDELVPFVQMTERVPLDVRFIEYMPFDGNRWSSSKFLSYAAMLQTVAKHFGRLENVLTHRGDTTKYYRVPGYAGRIGFITSMTDNFCSGCNRLRITADGNLKVCLFGKEEFSLRDLLRSGASDEDLDTAIRQALGLKHFSLGGNKDMYAISESENRSMVRIGG